MLGAILGMVLWCVAAVAAATILVCALPLRLELSVQKHEEWSFAAALRPLGKFGPRILLRRNESPTRPKARDDSRVRTRSAWKSRPKLFRALKKMASEVFACIRLESLACDVRFGLDDPAETGRVYGLLAPLDFGSSGVKRVRLSVEPVFDAAVLTGRVDLVLSLVPLSLVPPAIRFGWRAFGPTR